MTTPGLRVTDWASLNASLVWAYNDTYFLGGTDERTEPAQIAAWLVRQGKAKSSPAREAFPRGRASGCFPAGGRDARFFRSTPGCFR